MWPWDEHLKLGKTTAFVKRDLRLLPLTDAESEADSFLDRKSSTKRREAWVGMAVEREFGALLRRFGAGPKSRPESAGPELGLFQRGGVVRDRRGHLISHLTHRDQRGGKRGKRGEEHGDRRDLR